jgi:hypothetical protein
MKKLLCIFAIVFVTGCGGAAALGPILTTIGDLIAFVGETIIPTFEKDRAYCDATIPVARGDVRRALYVECSEINDASLYAIEKKSTAEAARAIGNGDAIEAARANLQRAVEEWKRVQARIGLRGAK